MAAGVEVVYVVPRAWPEPGSEPVLSDEPFPIIEVDVRRPGDVNRHSYTDPDAVAGLARRHHVDLVDVFEEPFSRASAQLLPRLPADLPVVMYSAQNLDKRWPPPFHGYERRSFRRVHAFYPCSRQAASVLRGKGFAGLLQPLPLGYDPDHFFPGRQSTVDAPLRLALVGRMVEEKGVRDAIHVLAHLRDRRGLDVHLVLAGSGPALGDAQQLAATLGMTEHLTHRPWLSPAALGELYRTTHVVLAPSRATATWVEQFGRTVVEGQASGCAVVGYDSGSLREVGTDAARLVAEGDTDALAAATANVLTDEDDFQSRRRQSLAAGNDRTWAAVAQRQAELYAAAAQRPRARSLSALPKQRRLDAALEFGPPATARGQARPFAIPILRRPGPLASALGHAMDRVSEIKARMTSS